MIGAGDNMFFLNLYFLYKLSKEHSLIYFSWASSKIFCGNILLLPYLELITLPLHTIGKTSLFLIYSYIEEPKWLRNYKQRGLRKMTNVLRLLYYNLRTLIWYTTIWPIDHIFYWTAAEKGFLLSSCVYNMVIVINAGCWWSVFRVLRLRVAVAWPTHAAWWLMCELQASSALASLNLSRHHAEGWHRQMAAIWQNLFCLVRYSINIPKSVAFR